MHAEKRKGRVRHGIDKVFYKIRFFFLYFIVFAAERDYPYAKTGVIQRGNFIRVKPAARYKIAGGVIVFVRSDFREAFKLLNARYSFLNANLAAEIDNVFVQLLG